MVDLEINGQGHDVQHSQFDGKCMTGYLMATVIFAIALTNYEIFENHIKIRKFDLENEGQGKGGEKQDLRHSTGNVRLYIGDFVFRNIAARQHVYAKR